MDTLHSSSVDKLGPLPVGRLQVGLETKFLFDWFGLFEPIVIV